MSQNAMPSNAAHPSPWTPDSVRQWFASRARTSTEQRPSVSAYHLPAAVLATFELNALRSASGAPPQSADLRLLLADCVPVRETPETARWSLKPEARRRALSDFADLPTLRAALTWNTRPVVDLLQQTLDGYILGTATPVEEQTEEQLSWSVQVVGWLAATRFVSELGLPPDNQVRQRLNYLRLLNPLKRMVGDHFRGRQRELTQLRTFLSLGEGQDFAPKPLMIHGFGGSGKTSLIAKFLLDYSEGRLTATPCPFVYLDFDRPGLLPQEPATLLLEATRQIAAQAQETRSAAENLALRLQSEIDSQAKSRARDDQPLGQILGTTSGPVYINAFADLFGPDARTGPAVVFVLDTFEEVQYRSQKVVEHVWSFLGELRSRLPRIRVIVSGRAPVQIEGHTSPMSVVIPLDELDPDAAKACLTYYGLPPEIARFVHDHIGGNPLALRLAGELFKKESQQGFREFVSAEFGERLEDTLIQAVLFRRILWHIKTRDVRKLAHPGLALRYITPEIIKDVLAGPCGIDVPTLERATELWKELSRETSVVVQESQTVLRHRPELRRQMIKLLRAKAQEQVDDIHRAAIIHYQKSDDDASRAEELYHRLCLGQPREELDRIWRPSLASHLESAREELPEQALIYLASRTGDASSGLESIGTGAEVWQTQELVTWERRTAQWAGDLIRQGRYGEVDKELRRRPERSPGSPLYLVHAEVLHRLDDPHAALDVLENALRDWPAATGRSERIDLLVHITNLLLEFGRHDEARRRLLEAAALIHPDDDSPARDLGMTRLALLLAPDPNRQSEAADELTRSINRWPQHQLRQFSELVRKVAAELLAHGRRIDMVDIVRVVGLGPLEPLQQQALGRALADWERIDIARGQRNLAFKAGLPNLAQSKDEQKWLRWVETMPPDVLGQRLARMLEEGLDPPPETIEVLAALLRGEKSLALQQAAQARTEGQRLSRGEIFEHLTNVIVDSFVLPELEQLVYYELNVRLDEIASPENSLRTIVFELVTWADRRGMLEKLVAAVIKARPNRTEMAQLMTMVENLRQHEA